MKRGKNGDTLLHHGVKLGGEIFYVRRVSWSRWRTNINK